jgi:hypothetical protein
MEMWQSWDAIIARAHLNADTGAFSSVVYGVWPHEFFRTPLFIVWLSTAYVALAVLWLIYRDQSRRLKKPVDPGVPRVAWNFVWWAFSSVATQKLLTAIGVRWYAGDAPIGWYNGVCLSLDTGLHGRVDAMLLLFLFVLLRPVKLYDVLFAEAHGTTEALSMLAYHLLAPVMCWMLAAFAGNTMIGVTWAALMSISDMWFHGYFIFKHVLLRIDPELRPSPVVKVLVGFTQTTYCWGGFLLAATAQTCAGQFTGNIRIAFLMSCIVMCALSIRTMNEKLFLPPPGAHAEPEPPFASGSRTTKAAAKAKKKRE